MLTPGMELPLERFARDFERQLAQFRTLAQPPWTRMLDELSRAQLAASRTFDLTIQHHLSQVDVLVNQIRHQSQDLEGVLRSAFPDWKRVLPTIDAARRPPFDLAPELIRTLNLAWNSSFLMARIDLLRVNELSMATALPMLRSLDGAVAQALSAQHQLRLESSFAAQLMRHIADIEEYSEDEQAVSERLRDLVAAFRDKCLALARDPAHAWGMFQTLLTLIIFIFGILSDRAIEHALPGQIERLETRTRDDIADAVRQMTTAIERLRPTGNDPVQYVILRDVRLRARPTSKSPSIRTIYPNEIAVLLDAKGTWIQVRVFDYINGSSHTGWVLKKYLKRLESAPPSPQPNP